ncbi:MAG: ABC transporter [Haloferacaceae archaeon]
MIRLLLAVVLASALLAASLPAVDDARRERTVARMDRAVDRLRDAAAAIRTDDPARDPSLAARRVVRVRLTSRSWTTAGVDAFRIDGRGPDRPPLVTCRLRGGRSISRRVDAPIETPDPVVLRERGVHRLALRFLLRGDRPVVVLRRG